MAQPFGLKLWISVENYLINKTYNDASRYRPYCTLYIRVCTNTPVRSAKNSKIRQKQGLQKWLAIFSGSTVRAETPDISGQLPNKQNVQWRFAIHSNLATPSVHADKNPHFVQLLQFLTTIAFQTLHKFITSYPQLFSVIIFDVIMTSRVTSRRQNDVEFWKYRTIDF